MNRVQTQTVTRTIRVLLVGLCLGLSGAIPWTAAHGQDAFLETVDATITSSPPTETVVTPQPVSTPPLGTQANEPKLGVEQAAEASESLDVAPSDADEPITEGETSGEMIDLGGEMDAAITDVEPGVEVIVDESAVHDVADPNLSADEPTSDEALVSDVAGTENAHETVLHSDAPEVTESHEDQLASESVQTGTGGESVETAPETVLDLVETAPSDNVEIVNINSVELAPADEAMVESLASSSDAVFVAAALVPIYDTPENAVAILVGEGISFSNVGYVGATVALGSFTGGTGIVGFEDGIILSSGDVKSVVGPNTLDGKSTRNNTLGDDDLSELVDEVTRDAAVLTFDFVPEGNKVVFSYVFSSEEYNEYVNSPFNDVFAFYVNGVNCATVDGGRVSVNSINNGQPFGSSNASNPKLFINNDVSDGGGAINTEMDGLTVVLTCEASVVPGQTNTMKLAIADTSDYILDSNVFIQARSLVVPTPTPEPGSTATSTPASTSTPTPDATATPTPKPGSTSTSIPKPGSTATVQSEPKSTAVPTEKSVPVATIETAGVTQLPNTGSGSQSSSMQWPVLALFILAATGLCIIAKRGTANP